MTYTAFKSTPDTTGSMTGKVVVAEGFESVDAAFAALRTDYETRGWTVASTEFDEDHGDAGDFAAYRGGEMDIISVEPA